MGSDEVLSYAHFHRHKQTEVSHEIILTGVKRLEAIVFSELR